MAHHRLAPALVATVVTCLLLVGGGPGSALPATSATDAAATGWGEPVAADPEAGDPTSVSCLSGDFCAVADYNGGVVIERNGVWHDARRLGPDYHFTSVSCATGSLCIAVGGMGSYPGIGIAARYDGTRWHQVAQIAGTARLTSVGCGTPTFCVAIDGEGSYVVFDGTSWSSPIAQFGHLDSDISCLSATFCMVINAGTSGTWRYDGSTWVNLDATSIGPRSAISCSRTTWCVLVGEWGEVETYDGTAWSEPMSLDSGVLRDISCAGDYCQAIDENGHSFTDDGSGWVKASMGTALAATNSCLADGTCTAILESGDAQRFADGVWSEPELVDRPAGDAEAISCASIDFCMVVDLYGNTVVYRHGNWGHAIRRDDAGFRDVDCVSPRFCVAVDEMGRALIYRDRAWTRAHRVSSGTLTSVSCAGPSFCVAVNIHGEAMTYDGSRWSPPLQVAGGGLLSVSCPASNFCAALSFGGTAYLFDGGHWTSQKVVRVAGASITCVSGTFCLAFNISSKYSIFDGESWRDPKGLRHRGAADVSCASPTFCAVVGRNRGFVSTGGTWTWKGTDGLDRSEGGYYFRSISCPTTTTCLALNSIGNVVTYTA